MQKKVCSLILEFEHLFLYDGFYVLKERSDKEVELSSPCRSSKFSGRLWLVITNLHIRKCSRPYSEFPLTIDASICLIIILKWGVTCARCFVAVG